MDKQKFDHYNQYLKKYFGYNKLKDKQYEIIYNIIELKKDVCAILPTGYGKSVCYQLPFLILNKTVFVVSPLISLMKDQMESMQKLNIPVACLNSSIMNKNKIKTNLLNGNHMIVYITPEYLVYSQEFIKEMYEKDNIALFAIDEAHCISEWGADSSFRPDYRKLKIIKKAIKNIPVLSLTATANKTVQKDICKSLRMVKPVLICGNLYRDNLNILIHKKNNIKKDILPLLYDLDGSCVIYAKTRDECDKIAEIIKNNNYKCESYHAGMDTQRRNEIQNQFINGDINIMVATIAFAMGIDKSNIRLVCHYGSPNDISSYYQEIGRAGRDGKKSNCIMFYSESDFRVSRYFLKDIDDQQFKKYKEKQIIKMEKFVSSSNCRWNSIIKYFDSETNLETCNTCDNCNNNILDTKVDLSEQVYILIKLLTKLNNKYGSTVLINILRGSKSKKITSFMKKISVYGRGINYSVKWWKHLIRILINENYLCEVTIDTGFGTTIKLTNKGILWYKNIVKHCKYEYPSNNISDLQIDDENKLILSVNDDFIQLFPSKSIAKKKEFKNDNLNQDIIISYTMFTKQGLTIEDIAKLRGIDTDEVENHLLSAVSKGYRLINTNLTNDNYSTILELINEQIDISVIVELFENNITEFDIRLAMIISENNIKYKF
jgi:RecQ family ATP-dependent DNA helicase